MGITRLAIKRPLTMLMIILALVVLGARAYTLMQVDRMPKADLPYVTIVVVYPGASPEDVTEQVIKPIEDAVASVSGVKNITAIANESVGAIVLEFSQGTSASKAAADVDRSVAAIRGTLPDGIREPTVIQADFAAVPIMQVVLNGPQGQDALYAVAMNDLKPLLESVGGVASVSVMGGRDRQILVEADPTRLAAYGLPMEAIQQALGLANVSAPAGTLEQGAQQNAIRSVGQFRSLAEIENVIVAGGPSPIQLPEGLLPKAPSGMNTGGVVTLHDVASVREGYADATRLVRHNGRDGVLLRIVKTGDANAIQVADAVRQQLSAFEEKLPTGASLDIVVDDSRFTRQAVAGVQEDLILAVLVTGLVMLLFLHTIRSTVIVLLAIPTSIIATFLVMWALGFSINTITMMALTLVIGILVDDSIVVLENIQRHLQLKEPPPQAALNGRSEIGLAAIAITLVDVVVYLPVAFTTGIIGQFFRSYGITIATATIFSLLVSFTLTPMLAAKWLRAEGEPEAKPRGIRRLLSILFTPVSWLWRRFVRAWDAGFDGLTRLYGATLRWILKNPLTQLLAVGIAVVALAAGIWLVVSGVVPTEFVPYQDDGQLTVSVLMPAGSSLAATDQAVRQMEEIIRKNTPEATAILSTVGTSGSSFLGNVTKANSASILVQLVDKNDRKRTPGDVVAALRPLLADVPGADVTLSLSSFMSGMPSGVTLQVHGPDQDKLIEVAKQVAAVTRRVPGVKDLRIDGVSRSPETQIVVDRARAKELGLTPGQIAYTLRLALTGSQVGTYKPSDTERAVDIVLRADETTRKSMDRMLSLPLGYVSGKQIRVDQVATVADTQAPGSVSRTNRENTLSVQAGGTGRGDADLANRVEAAVQSQVQFPPGYGYTLAGITQTQRESFTALIQALALSIVLIYMLLVALYQSWLQPLAIMFALPVTLVGAFGGLLVTGNTLNMMALLGIIMLAGIVTKNAILIVDFANKLREEQGYARKDALVTAGRLRLRPILMTTCAIVFALLPVLLATSAGSEFRAPLAAVVIGGNISSTLLTLILVPVIYNAFDAGAGKVSRVFRRLFAAPPQEPAVSPVLHTGTQG
jgi:HAE1 family hydrophobic/amphiphilic exporter-1